MRLGEFLVSRRELSEQALYEAAQPASGPARPTHLDPSDIPLRVARALPERVAREWRVLPFQVIEGSLLLGCSSVDSAHARHGRRCAPVHIARNPFSPGHAGGVRTTRRRATLTP